MKFRTCVESILIFKTRLPEGDRKIFLKVNNGANLYEVQKLLGHHSSQMTQRYAHLGDRELRAATDSVANSIGEAIR